MNKYVTDEAVEKATRALRQPLTPQPDPLDPLDESDHRPRRATSREQGKTVALFWCGDNRWLVEPISPGCPRRDHPPGGMFSLGWWATNWNIEFWVVEPTRNDDGRPNQAAIPVRVSEVVNTPQGLFIQGYATLPTGTIPLSVGPLDANLNYTHHPEGDR